MAKKIIKSGKQTFEVVCSKCGCKFSYELEDVHLFGVTCPECGCNILHPNQRDKDEDDEEWENFPNLDGYIKRRMWEMEQGVKRRREFHICENCKYYDGEDEYERCTKHDRVMWNCADSCEQFEFKEERK